MLASNNRAEDGRGNAPVGDLTLVEAALEVLSEADPFRKARAGEAAAARWLQGGFSRPYCDADTRLLTVPDRPARLPSVQKLFHLSCFQSFVL